MKHYNAGENHGRHKLTAEQVIEIKEYFELPKEARSKTMTQVADYLGVSLSTVRKIVAGRRWAGVKKISAPSPIDKCSHEDEFEFTDDDMPN
jgi:hypothetical protein